MLFVFFIFLSFVWFLCGDGRAAAPGERGRQGKESVSLLLVALPSQRTQPALGQYLVTCTAEQHAISF